MIWAKSPHLCQGKDTFSAQPRSWELPLSLHFLLTQRLQVTRGEKLEPSWVFRGHAPSPALACGLLDFQEHIGAFQNPLWTSHSPVFHVNVLLSLLVAPTVVSSSESCHVKQCHWLFLTNTLEKRLFVQSEVRVRSNKDKLWDRSNGESFLGKGSLGRFKTIFLFQRLLGYLFL